MAKPPLINWLDLLPPSVFRIGMNLWPPFLGSGIKVASISPDFREVKVVLKLRRYNKNNVGVHFGGSMFAMTDPFFMIMLMKNLGGKYIVWDKAAAIEFKKPGRGTLYASFTFTEDEIQHIRSKADQHSRYIFDKAVDILNDQGENVATVLKTLYVKNKETTSP
ncbi:DUF4442 domain-containing protein [Aquicella lusitana]|uniref:Acyl-coenzyme A thioesterase PaaI-like protein n=1 Tax=Aquicella lusitana TaxID=254246 RepID=A0A370FYG7_9COXI|nr:DUF4442 domain-containing protein [Aquicella lusitana]RDI36677.1 acyl-coenzyme A thioesterase PaaI-like protein [Aquicella lusitana]VVC72545.1 hypothetical protein AQULUS_02570 [Aquicella lusitana]